MSTSPDYLLIGNETGNDLTDTRSPCTFSRTFITSAALKSVTKTVPVSAQLLAGTVVLAAPVTGSVASFDVRVGVSASAAQYGTVRVSGAGIYNIALTRFAASLDAVSQGQIVIDVTAATSGATLPANVVIRLLFGRI